MMQPVDHIYISPHLDDAVLSCGGLIDSQVKAGEAVLIISLFTAGLPCAELSPSLRNMHAVWGFDESDPFETRRAEDAAAASTLGAHFLHMGWQGALYRRIAGKQYFYRGLSYFGSPDPQDETQQIKRIAALINELRAQHPTAKFYFPLAIGEHVDHVLAHSAARKSGGQFSFYEDVPYVLVGRVGPIMMRLLAVLSSRGVLAGDYGAGGAAGRLVAAAQAGTSLFSGPGLTLRMRGRGSGLRWRQTLHGIDVAAKLDAVEQYETQLPMVFGSKSLARQAIARYAAHIGSGAPAERLWHLA